MARHSTGFWLLQLQTMTLTVLTVTNPPVESQATLLSDRASAGGVRPMLQQIVDQLDVVRQLAAKLDWCEKVVPHSRACPDTFEYRSEVNSCYKLISQSLSWSDAERNCRTLHRYAHLAFVESEVAQTTIEKLVQCGQGASSRWWLGGQRINVTTNSTFVWKMSTPKSDTSYWTLAFNYTFWNASQPDFWRQEESCLQLFDRSGSNKRPWNDASCEKIYPSICEVDAWQYL